jgi:hypothetical protein
MGSATDPRGTRYKERADRETEKRDDQGQENPAGGGRGQQARTADTTSHDAGTSSVHELFL